MPGKQLKSDIAPKVGFAGYPVPKPEPVWLSEAVRRVEQLSRKRAGWKGTESHEMIPNVKKHARYFLSRLADEKIVRRPSVGLDYEGTVSFSWHEDDLHADLTIYEDGSYSYFAKRNDTMASSDDSKISQPLDAKLLHLLRS